MQALRMGLAATDAALDARQGTAQRSQPDCPVRLLVPDVGTATDLAARRAPERLTSPATRASQ